MGGDFRPDLNIYKLFVWRPSPSLLCLQLMFMCVLSHRVAFLDPLQGDFAQSNCLQMLVQIAMLCLCIIRCVGTLTNKLSMWRPSPRV